MSRSLRHPGRSAVVTGTLVALFAWTATALISGQAKAPSTTVAARKAAPARKAATVLPTLPIHLPGGRFTMGGGERPEENPAHQVIVKPFSIDATEVTVARFGRFVAATKYRTEAEKWGWSGVFSLKEQRWMPVNGATWRNALGPSSAPSKANDPVTHVSWNDAKAFCAYEKGRLPTEAEWEFAARGGKNGETFPWGEDLRPGGKPAANWWQGEFPTRLTKEDGFAGVAPVGSFKPNGYGLYDMVGNVWEWNSDWFDFNYYGKSPADNPTGPAQGKDRVMRGGSWMCSENFCRNFRNAARSFSAPDSGLDNLGFRCAYDLTKP
ncbi:MAG: formylglycine-generating enzyme family protein [Vicinamibacteria bacterium]